MINEVIYSKCKSKGIIRRRYTETKLSGKKQRYYCKSCNRK